MITETAAKKDIPVLKSLWKEAFGDSDDFIEWYFANRFDEKLTSVTRDNDRIVSMAYCQPMNVSLRGRVIPSVMLGGVYTIPEYRKKGLMHENVLLLEKHSAKVGASMMIDTPAGKNHYHTLGHRYITACEKRTLTQSHGEMPRLISDMLSYAEDTLSVYKRMTKGYSCMIERDIQTQKERFSDYLSDNGRLILHHENGKLTSYAVVYELKDKYYSPECVYSDDLDGILNKLSNLDKPCTVKLPLNTTPTAVATITDAKALLKNFDLPYSIEVMDDNLPHNNGVFSLDGAQHRPIMKISAPSLMELLSGYLDFNQICDIIVYCDKGCRELSALLPKQKCYMIEEY